MKFTTDSEIKEIDQKLLQVLTSKDEDTWSSKSRIKNIHTLFRYPAVMVPHMLEDLLEIILETNPEIKNIFDPFMGSGTSLVTSMKFGKNCYGQDVNPLAVLISKVKTGPFFTDALELKIPRLINRINNDSSNKIVIDYRNYSYWFEESVAVDLSKIYRSIKRERNIHIRRFFWVNLAETVRLTSNDRTSTYKLHRRSKEEIKKRSINPIRKFKNILLSNFQDLINFKEVLNDKQLLTRGFYSKDLNIWLEDSKNKIHHREKNQLYDLLVTSPPYGDNKTTVPYGQHSHLPLLWIDFEDIDPKANTSYLRTQSEIDNLSIGGKMGGNFEKIIPEITKYSITLERALLELEAKPKQLTKKVAFFYKDLFRSIENAIQKLKVNGYMVWIVGNRRVGDIEIHTDKILTEFLKYKGGIPIKDLNREIRHKRMPSRNNISKTMNREKILIFRKAST